MNAVDTNILIYTHDPRDEVKQAVAVALVGTLPDGVLLWQVACEYVAAAYMNGYIERGIFVGI